MGLGSKLSTWDKPPFMNRKMTCFALGLKCGSLIFHAGVASASAMDLLTMPAKLIMAKPPPILRRASRRVMGLGLRQDMMVSVVWAATPARIVALAHVHKFV